MPRSRRAKPAPPDDDAPIEFGPRPLDLPPPPVKAPAAPEPPKGSPPPSQLVDLGDPPTDILGLRAYTARAYAVMMRQAMLDPTLSAEGRAKAVRHWGRAIESLKADSEVWEALEAMRRDRADLEQPNRGAKLEPAPANGAHASPS